MNSKLQELREQITNIDNQLIPLFVQRMQVTSRVAELKRLHNLPLLDAERENLVVANAVSLGTEELTGDIKLFMRTILALSRGYQRRLLHDGSAPMLPKPQAAVSQDAIVAYQGVQGAWGEQAAATLFPGAQRLSNEQFEDVFLAIKEGRANYGVVPIENSNTGAIGENYDLLRRYGCFIVGRTWIQIRQCLLGVNGAGLSDIKRVYSHPEGFRQSRSFLQDKSWDLVASRNTAVAAQKVAETGSIQDAAIGSRLAAQIYGLDVIEPDIMDAGNNQTSFIVISAQPEYAENSNLISITFSTQHHAGALCDALIPFMAEGLNLDRIESRPLGNGKYRFFAELEGNIDNEQVLRALRQAAAASEYFEVLGCYSCTD